MLRIVNTEDWPSDSREALWASVLPSAEVLAEFAPDEFSADYLLDGLRRGTLTLWLALDEKGVVQMTMFTEVRHFRLSQKTFVNVVGICGEGMDDIMPEFHLLDDWARARGAELIRVRGRRGWVRKLKAQGYEWQSVTLVKDLMRENDDE